LQVVHRLSDAVQLPPVTPCQSPDHTAEASKDQENTQRCGVAIDVPLVQAPQVSLTTDDGDDFDVWFGRRGSIFIVIIVVFCSSPLNDIIIIFFVVVIYFIVINTSLSSPSSINHHHHHFRQYPYPRHHRGSIFIEERGATQRQMFLAQQTTRNAKGQVSLAVPKPAADN